MRYIIKKKLYIISMILIGMLGINVYSNLRSPTKVEAAPKSVNLRMSYRTPTQAELNEYMWLARPGNIGSNPAAFTPNGKTINASFTESPLNNLGPAPAAYRSVDRQSVLRTYTAVASYNVPDCATNVSYKLTGNGSDGNALRLSYLSNDNLGGPGPFFRSPNWTIDWGEANIRILTSRGRRLNAPYFDIKPNFPGFDLPNNQGAKSANFVTPPIAATPAELRNGVRLVYSAETLDFVSNVNFAKLFQFGVKEGREYSYRTTGHPYLQVRYDTANCAEQEFNISTDGTTNFDDPENPTKAIFTGEISSDRKVTGIDVACTYTQIKGGNPSSLGSDSKSKATLNLTYDCDEEVNVSAAGLTAGDKVCQLITASPGSGKVNSAGVISSPGGPVPPLERCATVVNRPFVSFYGGDVNVGSGFDNGSGCIVSGVLPGIQTYNRGSTGFNGSGAQLAVKAIGVIEATTGKGFPSSMINGGAPKGLTFANTTGGSYGGEFGSTECMPNYFADSAELTSTLSGTINLGPGPGSLDGGNYLRGTDVTLSGQLRDKQRYSIFIDGNLTIASNIDYASGSWSSYADIPSLLVFVKGNIYIKPGVTSITGMFVAQDDSGSGGIIDTCQSSSQGTNGECNNQLTVNGSLSAKKIQFRKVANSQRDDSKLTGPTSNAGSEKFIFTPEQWIVRPERIPGEESTTGKYDYFTVLPPIL